MIQGIGRPATSLSRPLKRLVGLGLVRRDVPAGSPPRDAKRSAYRLADPFLRFWFRFVEPNRSILEAGRVDVVAREVDRGFAGHAAGVFEDLVRESVSHRKWLGIDWKPASPWWGNGLDGTPMEIDVVAESVDGASLLVGEAKWTSRGNAEGLLDEVRRKAVNLPLARDRKLSVAVWTKSLGSQRRSGGGTFGPERVVGALM